MKASVRRFCCDFKAYIRSAGFATVLVLTLPSQLLAVEKSEKVFQDPKTGKSGKYTLALPGSTAKAKSTGLMVFFHGSGGTSTYANGFDSLQNIANGAGLVALAVQAPNGADTWANHAVGPSNKHDVYVKSLLEKLFSSVPALDHRKVVFVGLSAGATFLSGDFLPKFIASYKGGAVFLCGGGGPVVTDKEVFAALKKEASVGMPLTFYIQKKDFLYQQTLEGISYWRSRKADVMHETPDGGSHCGFDVNKEMGRLVKNVLERKK